MLLASEPEDDSAKSIFAKLVASQLANNPELVDEFLPLVGGHNAVMKVSAEKIVGSRTSCYDSTGDSSQSVTAVDDSVIIGVTQTKRT